jgi:hypothetical protein
MTSSIKTDPPNFFVLIADRLTENGLPNMEPGPQISASTTCVKVDCQSDFEDPTTFTMGPASEVNPKRPPAFDGFLETPNRKMTLWTCELEKMLEERVPTARTRVRVWCNRTAFATEVLIGLGD